MPIIKNKKIVAIIPARGGSGGIPRKNIVDLAGKPLIAYAIEAAKNSRYISDVYVSTENNEIAEISKKFGAKIIKRPAEMATSKAKSEEALLHFAEQVDFDVLVFLQCTSALTISEDVDGALETYFTGSYDSVLSATLDHGGFLCGSFLWDEDGNSINYDYRFRPMRQDLKQIYRENGAIYITSKKDLIKSKNRLNGKIGFYIMPSIRSYEIDDMNDLNFLREIFYAVRRRGGVNTLQKKIKLIKLAIFDVDGIFTDGSVYSDKNGNETLKFSRIDGKGIELLKNKKVKTAVITSENSSIVKARMEKLKIDDIFIGVKNKVDIFLQLRKKYSLENEEICYLGDDIQDLEVMKLAGVSFCPSNAQKEIKSICDYVSSSTGSQNFVREICNIILEIIDD